MTTLVLALYAEGPTDKRFLPIVVQRTAERILVRRGQSAVDVVGPIVVNGCIDRETRERDRRILEAARRAAGYHVLIVHADADHPSPDRALAERINPGFELVRNASEPVCTHLVAVIPVRCTEAWLLADPSALCRVIGTNMPPHQLGLPQRPRQVEDEPDPEAKLRQACEIALSNRPRRRRQMPVSDLYEPLGRQIDLQLLGSVPAYQRFVQDLTATLIDLHLAY